MDKETIEQFEAGLRGNLYKFWNRMSSGSYFPPPVRAVSIPKKSGAWLREGQVNGGRSGGLLGARLTECYGNREKTGFDYEKCSSEILVYSFILARVNGKSKPEVELGAFATAPRALPDAGFRKKINRMPSLNAPARRSGLS